MVRDAADAAGGRVGLVGCVKSKKPVPAPARELYTSALFKGRRSYVEASCDRWFILSAEHGLVSPEQVLAPYDVTLKGASAARRREWTIQVIAQLTTELGDLGGRVFEVHAGADYLAGGLVAELRSGGAAVELPMQGLSMGRQLAFYRDAARGGDGAPPRSGRVPDADASRATRSRSREDVSNVAVERAVACLAEAGQTAPGDCWDFQRQDLEVPGLYAWWVDGPGVSELAQGLGMPLPHNLIYVGEAGATKWPSGRPSSNTLGKRLTQMHLLGRVEFSTFRLSLAAILLHRLQLRVVGPRLLSPDSEVKLSDWMAQRLSVATHPVDDPDSLGDLEAQVVRRLDPTLNLRHLEATPLRRRLRELRRPINRGG